MPRSRPPYPAEFRMKMGELVRSGRTPEELAREFGPSSQAIRNLVREAFVLGAAGRGGRRRPFRGRQGEPAVISPRRNPGG